MYRLIADTEIEQKQFKLQNYKVGMAESIIDSKDLECGGIDVSGLLVRTNDAGESSGGESSD